jgi:8-oxo-dGTP pyrophosphatase MutT (NUDIX family)
MPMSTDSPWTTLSSREIYANPWMSVREDQVIRPDGNPGIYGVVSTRVAAGVVAIDDSGGVVLVGQYRYPTEQYSWEIIAGGGPSGDDPEVIARRELQEEAGLEAATLRPLGGPMQLSNCISSEIGHLFLATDLSATASSPDPTEVLELRTVPLQAAVRMVEAGEITDAFSVMGLLLAGRLVD